VSQQVRGPSYPLPRLKAIRNMKSLLCISALLLSAVLQAAAGEKGIADYFLELPQQEFTEGPPIDLMNSGLNRLIDSRNGYMFLEGNGAQVSLEIALFLYPNRQPLLAVAWGNYMEEAFTHLSFFTERNGRMVSFNRAILPVSDSGDLRFELPRKGLTVVIRDSSGKVTSLWTWNRTRFVED
jgi:hypothetical protein